MVNDDRSLVQKLLAGDRDAFDACFGEYYPKLYRFALRRLGGDAPMAEDVAQATLCRALESLHTYRGEATLYTWLCTLCRRELATRCNSQARSTALEAAEDDPEIRAALESLLAASADDPVLSADASQLSQAVLAVLDYLVPLYATVLELKYVQELSVAVIAERIGRSPKATESVLTRARLAFREAFSLLHGGLTPARDAEHE